MNNDDLSVKYILSGHFYMLDFIAEYKFQIEFEINAANLSIARFNRTVGLSRH